ncbi:hypothetical protein Zmor_010132 [Zophobas morio]|uniref:Phorbol-ester/DAG-type domain-containing protein n=1 Tax=Zophobas morio TaxID=2755281 RepID=A0AA38IQF2_9CUCU|nr:hypothetical protein Zmor_010132 [Zophobas morio]
MSSKCPSCKRNCKDGLTCDICKQSFHPNCAGVSPEEAECLRSPNRKVRYFCDKCNIMDVVTNLQQEIDELKKQIVELKKATEERAGGTDNNTVNTTVVAADKQLIDEELINEIFERQQRANNLIIYNLSEDNLNEGEGEISDTTKILNLVGTQIIKEESVCKCVRLGKAVAGKIRPLLLRLKAPEDVIRVLKMYRPRNNVYVNRDLTVRQRNIAYNIRKEFKIRKEAGEQNIKMKYTNGIPKIIQEKN